MIITKQQFFEELKNCELIPATYSQGFLEYLQTQGKQNIIFQKTKQGLNICLEMKPSYYHSLINLTYGGIVPYKKNDIINVKQNLEELKIEDSTFCSYSFFPEFKHSFNKVKAKHLYNTFILDLKLFKSTQEIFEKLDRKERNVLRKAMLNEIIIKETNNDKEINDFIELIKQNYSRLGGGHTINEDLIKLSIKKDSGIVLLAYKKTELIGGVFVIKGKGHWWFWHAASSENGRNLKSNNLLFWNIIEKAFNCGIEFLDYGSSELNDLSHSKFKENMLGKKQPVFVVNQINDLYSYLFDKYF